MSWADALVAGDCVDGKAPSGDWEIAIIDEMSPTGTEISVTWSTGINEWVSLDSGRFAKFGTKSGVGDDNDAPVPITPPPSVAVTGGAAAGTQNTPVMTAEGKAWREGLKAGDLIDARDKSGFWYQVHSINRTYSCMFDVRVFRVDVACGFWCGVVGVCDGGNDCGECARGVHKRRSHD
jgi:hypothetical protein